MAYLTNQSIILTGYAYLAGRSGGQILTGGTAVTDVMSFIGTSGNGTLISPAIQFKVGNNGATTAMTILNNGNVGIGTTGPGATLHVVTPTASGGGEQTALILGNKDFTAGMITSQLFQAGTDTGSVRSTAAIKAKQVSATTGELQFYTDAAGLTQKMVIDTSGNVGIGITAPTSKFVSYVDRSVAADISPAEFYYKSTAGNVASSVVNISSEAPGGNNGNEQILFKHYGPNTPGGVSTNASIVVTAFDAATPYGIMNFANKASGDSSPVTRLQLTDKNVYVGGYLEDGYGIVFQVAGAGGIANKKVIAIDRNANTNIAGNSLQVIAGGGFVGGTNTNGGDLLLSGGISTGTGTSIIRFSTSTTGSSGTSDNTPTEKMTILGSGNVGIGTTSPTAVLHLKAGTATASTAPLKFNSGTLLTTAEAGAVEFLTDAFYGTETTNAVRNKFVMDTTGRATGQTAANASVATYTLGAADASFEVSANVLVTTSSAEAFTVTVDYTDEGNTARTITLPFALIAGTFSVNIAFANGAVPYEGVPLHIRCKASTAITIKTAAGGTYTGATYNVEGIIKKI